MQRVMCEPLGEHLSHWTCFAFSLITQKMNNVSIFSHDQDAHGITARQCSSNDRKSAIWGDTNIGICVIVETTAQSMRIAKTTYT